MINAYAVYSPDGEIKNIGLTAYEAWAIPESPMRDKIFNTMQEQGYTVRPVVIAEGDEVAISKDVFQHLKPIAERVISEYGFTKLDKEIAKQFLKAGDNNE